MEAFFSWIAAAFGALFIVAVLVAWWEHLVRSARPVVRREPQAPRAVRIDVPLDTAAGVLLPLTDSSERRAALGGTMERLGRTARAVRIEDSAAAPAVPPGADSWNETSPMVLQPEPAPAPSSARHPTSRI